MKVAGCSLLLISALCRRGEGAVPHQCSSSQPGTLPPSCDMPQSAPCWRYPPLPEHPHLPGSAAYGRSRFSYGSINPNPKKTLNPKMGCVRGLHPLQPPHVLPGQAHAPPQLALESLAPTQRQQHLQYTGGDRPMCSRTAISNVGSSAQLPVQLRIAGRQLASGCRGASPPAQQASLGGEQEVRRGMQQGVQQGVQRTPLQPRQQCSSPAGTADPPLRVCAAPAAGAYTSARR